MENTPVSKIMTREVIIANLFNRFTQVRKLFFEYNLHHLPVVDDEKVIGIISSTDLLNAYARKMPKDVSLDDKYLDSHYFIKELMTPKPTVISPSDSVKKAASLLAGNKFQALPVVEDGKIAGIVTTRDLVKYLSKQS